MVLIKKFFILTFLLLLSCNISKEQKEHPAPSSIQSPVPTVKPSPLPTSVIEPITTPLPPGVRKKIIDALTEQLINDPIVHLKYRYWGGNSPHDLAEYIWMKYRWTEWEVTPQEAQVLKFRAIKALDRIYRKKRAEINLKDDFREFSGEKK